MEKKLYLKTICFHFLLVISKSPLLFHLLHLSLVLYSSENALTYCVNLNFNPHFRGIVQSCKFIRWNWTVPEGPNLLFTLGSIFTFIMSDLCCWIFFFFLWSFVQCSAEYLKIPSGEGRKEETLMSGTLSSWPQKKGLRNGLNCSRVDGEKETLCKWCTFQQNLSFKHWKGLIFIFL